MELFQRPPEELDDCDIGRILRTLEAQDLIRAGRGYRRWMSGDADWETVRKLDPELLIEIKDILTDGTNARTVDIIIQGQDRASQALASVNRGLKSVTNLLTLGMFSMGIAVANWARWLGSSPELGHQSRAWKPRFATSPV